MNQSSDTRQSRVIMQCVIDRIDYKISVLIEARNRLQALLESNQDRSSGHDDLKRG